MPQRIRRQRTKGWKMPEGAIYVGRPTPYGNPHKVGEDGAEGEYVSAASCLTLYRMHLKEKYPDENALTEFLAPLRGHDLACFCKLDAPCHADVLLELANQ